MSHLTFKGKVVMGQEPYGSMNSTPRLSPQLLELSGVFPRERRVEAPRYRFTGRWGVSTLGAVKNRWSARSPLGEYSQPPWDAGVFS